MLLFCSLAALLLSPTAAHDNEGVLSLAEDRKLCPVSSPAESRRYTCDPMGNPTCQDGWSGSACDTPLCHVNGTGCGEHGTCVEPDRCRCNNGYAGPLCDQCVRLPGCLYGTCNGSYECNCLPGWKGSFCEEPVCREGCQGYCKLPGECICMFGYKGDNCSQCIPAPDCQYGSCDKPFECECQPGWSGPLCNQAICRNGCNQLHGECRYPDECICKTGFVGQTCDECHTYPGCENGYCRNPWECICLEGWTGELCNVRLNATHLWLKTGIDPFQQDETLMDIHEETRLNNNNNITEFIREESFSGNSGAHKHKRHADGKALPVPQVMSPKGQPVEQQPLGVQQSAWGDEYSNEVVIGQEIAIKNMAAGNLAASSNPGWQTAGGGAVEKQRRSHRKSGQGINIAFSLQDKDRSARQMLSRLRRTPWRFEIHGFWSDDSDSQSEESEEDCSSGSNESDSRGDDDISDNYQLPRGGKMGMKYGRANYEDVVERQEIAQVNLKGDKQRDSDLQVSKNVTVYSGSERMKMSQKTSLNNATSILYLVLPSKYNVSDNSLVAITGNNTIVITQNMIAVPEDIKSVVKNYKDKLGVVKYANITRPKRHSSQRRSVLPKVENKVESHSRPKREINKEVTERVVTTEAGADYNTTTLEAVAYYEDYAEEGGLWTEYFEAY